MLIYGFAVALDESLKNRERHYAAAQDVRNFLVMQIKPCFPDAVVHGIERSLKDTRVSHLKDLAPHLVYISFPNINHGYLATLLDANGFTVSTGSACDPLERRALRVGVLPTTTKRAVRALVRCIRKQLPIARNM